MALYLDPTSTYKSILNDSLGVCSRLSDYSARRLTRKQRNDLYRSTLKANRMPKGIYPLLHFLHLYVSYLTHLSIKIFGNITRKIQTLTDYQELTSFDSKNQQSKAMNRCQH